LHTDLHANPALIVALALAAGITAQVVARHLRLPGIVLLLGVGVVLGPDGLGFVQPEVLGESLHILVGFAVAVILFEGGLNLRWSRIRRQAGVIRLLLSVGVVVTALGGAVAARLFLGWDWTLSLLFGTLVIVTGPTVITPLLRRIRVRRPLETILETEGVFVDGIGAITAIVCLEVALRPEGSSLAGGFLGLPSRLVFGLLFGLGGGLVLAFALRWRRAIGEGLENAFTLALVLVLFQASNALMAETGIITAIVAGLVVGNIRSPVQRELKEFKEQLTVLLIGMLFILLAADVRLAEIRALGWPGLLTVLALMLVVRPLSVLICTWRMGMPWRERTFLAWIAPRGIVAAAVATLFDERLTAAGASGGQEMRALVFLVIAATVLFQGATAQYLAAWLGVRRATNDGFAILGANPLARTLGRLLLRQGEPVVLMDSSVTKHRKAQEEAFRVVYGNALEEWAMLTAGVESRKVVLATLRNSAVNLLFARKAREEFKAPRAAVAVHSVNSAVDAEMVAEAGATMLFGGPVDLELWNVRIRRGRTGVERWRCPAKKQTGDKNGAGESERGHLFGNGTGMDSQLRLPPEVQNGLLPLVRERAERVVPIDNETKLQADDRVFWLVDTQHRDEVVTWLKERDWRFDPVPETESDSTSDPGTDSVTGGQSTRARST